MTYRDRLHNEGPRSENDRSRPVPTLAGTSTVLDGIGLIITGVLLVELDTDSSAIVAAVAGLSAGDVETESGDPHRERDEHTDERDLVARSDGDGGDGESDQREGDH